MFLEDYSRAIYTRKTVRSVRLLEDKITHHYFAKKKLCKFVKPDNILLRLKT